jgi:hypothetical protein
MTDIVPPEAALPFEISEADILKEMAELTSEGWTAEQILRLSAVLLLENERLEKACLMHQDAFDELHEKYQISEENWQVQWEKKDEFFRARDLELHNLHNKHINVVIEQAKEVAVTGIAEAYKNSSPEVVNPILEKMGFEVFQPAIEEARLAGRKEGSKVIASQGGKAKDKKLHEPIRVASYAWFEKNFHLFKSAEGCAAAAALHTGYEKSTMLTYLKIWKSKQKRNM